MLSALYDGVINSSVNLGAAQTWGTAGGRTLTINGVISGTGNLTLNGHGTVALPALNTHSGTITVSNGTLLVSGATGTNTLTVTGGTLSGNGKILGPVVVGAGSTLAPGNAVASIDTLTISNTLTLQTRSLLSFDINESAGTCDKVIGLTSVTFGGILVLNNQAGTFAPSDAFKLFDARSYVGAFDKITPVTPGANMAWDTSTLTNDGTLRVTSTLATNITAQAAPGLVNLSWPTDHTGWRLQAQTNLPHVGLTTNWVTVVGSENLIRPQIVDLQRLAAELSPPVSRALARSDAA
jgi:autotransporter-associated beta strand protein